MSMQQIANLSTNKHTHTHTRARVRARVQTRKHANTNISPDDMNRAAKNQCQIYRTRVLKVLISFVMHHINMLVLTEFSSRWIHSPQFRGSVLCMCSQPALTHKISCQVETRRETTLEQNTRNILWLVNFFDQQYLGCCLECFINSIKNA